MFGCCATEVLCVVVMIIRGLQSGCAGGLRAVPPWSRCGPVVAGVSVCCTAVMSLGAMEPLWPSGGWGQCMLHCCDVLVSHGAVVAQWWLGSVYAALL